MSKPKFDPSKPFEPVSAALKPAFDPSAPLDAPAQAPMAGAASGPGRAEAFARGGAQGVTFGFGDEINGAIQALGQKYLPESLGGGGEQAQGRSLMDLYRGSRDSFRREDAAAERSHGRYYLGGNIAGGIATAPLMSARALQAVGLASKAAPAAAGAKTLWQLMKEGGKLGAASGSAIGLGASNADLTRGEFGGAAADTALGTMFGAGFGMAAPAVTQGAGWAVRNVGGPLMKFLRGGYIKPTPEAERLLKEGAELTLGQMDPNSAMGRLEELAAAKWTGGGVSGLREEGVATTRDALLKRAAAPGATPPTRGAPVMSQIDEIGRGFTEGYDDVLKGVRLEPEKYLGQGKWRGLVTDESLKGSAKLKGAFELAAGDKGINASDKVRAQTLAWLRNEATSLRPTKSGPNAGKVDAQAIQGLRTRLRDELRALGDSGDDRAIRQILERAEGFVSELLEGQLPPANAAQLRALDASYRNKLAVERAANGAKAFKEGEGGEFTATALLEAIRQKGATPELESLARDAHRTLGAKYTPTGMMGHALNAAPLSEYAAAPLSYLVNTVGPLRQHALRQAFAPGLPAKAFAATGRALEKGSRSAPTTATTARSLYDLLTAPADDPLPWGSTP